MSNLVSPSSSQDGQVYARDFARKYYNMTAAAANAAAQYIDLGSCDPTPRTRLGVIVLLPKNNTPVVIQLDRKERQIAPGWKSLGSEFHTAATLMETLPASERTALKQFFFTKAIDANAGGNSTLSAQMSGIGLVLDL